MGQDSFLKTGLVVCIWKQKRTDQMVSTDSNHKTGEKNKQFIIHSEKVNS